MFARWLVLTVKTGKKIDVLEGVRKEILPMIEKYSGFLGVLPLEPFDEPLKVYVMSLWEDRRDAEKYERESFAAVTHILEPFLVLPSVVKRGTIDETITTLVTASLPDGSENINQILPHYRFQACLLLRDACGRDLATALSADLPTSAYRRRVGLFALICSPASPNATPKY